MVRKDAATTIPETVSGATKTAECTKPEPTVEQVRSRAYEIYRGRRLRGEIGDTLADWVAAERELTVGGNGGPQAKAG
jgi:hypothetical protein